MKNVPLAWALSSFALFFICYLALRYFILEEPINSALLIQAFFVSLGVAVINYFIYGRKREKDSN